MTDQDTAAEAAAKTPDYEHDKVFHCQALGLTVELIKSADELSQADIDKLTLYLVKEPEAHAEIMGKYARAAVRAGWLVQPAALSYAGVDEMKPAMVAFIGDVVGSVYGKAREVPLR